MNRCIWKDVYIKNSFLLGFRNLPRQIEIGIRTDTNKYNFIILFVIFQKKNKSLSHISTTDVK